MFRITREDFILSLASLLPKDKQTNIQFICMTLLCVDWIDFDHAWLYSASQVSAYHLSCITSDRNNDVKLPQHLTFMLLFYSIDHGRHEYVNHH